MADVTTNFITAVSDSACEGFISASLQRQGYRLLYRALSPRLLAQFLEASEEEKSIIVMSPEFFTESKEYVAGFPTSAEIVIVQSAPTTDFEVAQLIRPTPSQVAHIGIALGEGTHAVGVGSIGSRVGASTLALNIGYELSLKGVNTLVVDANPRSHFLMEHCGIFGLNRGVHRFSDSLSLLEISSPHSVEEWIGDFNNFEIVIVDVGELFDFHDALVGRRKGDGSLRWIAHHGDDLIIVSDEEVIQRAEAIEQWRKLQSTAMNPFISLLLNNVGGTGRGERQRKLEALEKLLNTKITCIDRDNRSILTMKSQRSALGLTAPKSRIRHQMMEYAMKGRWLRR